MQLIQLAPADVTKCCVSMQTRTMWADSLQGSLLEGDLVRCTIRSAPEPRPSIAALNTSSRVALSRHAAVQHVDPVLWPAAMSMVRCVGATCDAAGAHAHL